MEWSQNGLADEIRQTVERASTFLKSPGIEAGHRKANAEFALANIEFAKILIEIREKHSNLLLVRDGLNRSHPDHDLGGIIERTYK